MPCSSCCHWRDHTHILVVQNEDLDRQIVLDGAGHFLNAHLDRGVTGNVDDQRIRMSDLNADGGREAVTHRAKATGGHPAVRLFEAEELCRPHLVLADFGGDVGIVPPGRFRQTLQRILRHDDVVGILVGKRVACPPARDLAMPLRRLRLFRLGRQCPPQTNHIFQNMTDITDDRNVDANILVDRGRIDIDVDLLGIGRKGIQPAGNTVVETRADTDHDVTIMHGHVGFVRTMHAEHAQPLVPGGGIRAETHQGGGDRETSQLDQLRAAAGWLPDRN